jgi:hypothetical protein
MPAEVAYTASLPGLSPVAGKPIIARFDGGLLSSDGGLLALREIEPGFAVSRQTVQNWWRFQTLAANGFQACVYAAAVDCGASSTARICLGTDMPKVFSIADSSAAIFVR